jgi:hypothetical protein
VSEQPIVNHAAAVADMISAAAVVGSLMGYLPDIAAGAALVWYIAQIYDSNLGRRFGRFLKKKF